MKMDKWSGFDKYCVMLGGSGPKVDGALMGYQAYLDFIKVKEVLLIMSKSDSNYSYKGDTYSRVITSSRALQILMKISECRWDEDIITVAKQIGANRMLSPRG
jgi:hypothetical protein|tara:strand:- start:90 stop:398 length:309 start_codon:yes stop_codon:yes gene_type:complete